MLMKKESFVQGLQMKDIPDIWEPTGRALITDDDIVNYIELPLRQAIKILVDKRVKTYFSTANRNNTLAFVIIEPNYLSPANIQVAKDSFGYEGREHERISLELPITPDTFAEAVEEFFISLAEKFVEQKEWAATYHAASYSR